MQLCLRISLIVCLSMVALVSAAYANMIETKAPYAYMVDLDTGEVLLDKNAEVMMGPSSMTKMMTAYLVFDALKNERISLDTKFPVSETAWRKGGSKMFVKAGDDVKVKDLLQGIIVQSGNDACIVVAEGLSGTEKNFAEDMNFMAKKIGLENSYFKNSTGWPDEGHYMTAKDLVTLAMRLHQDFPEYMHYYKQTEYTYNGIKQSNRNRLLTRNIGVDGFKTGYTEDNGYGITVTAEQDGRRVFLAINGLETSKARIAEAERLVHHAFRDYKMVDLYEAGERVSQAEVWLGKQRNVPLAVKEDVKFIVVNRPSKREDIQLEVSYTGPLDAPIREGQEIAELHVLKEGEKFKTVPLVAATAVEKTNFLEGILARASYYLMGKLQ